MNSSYNSRVLTQLIGQKVGVSDSQGNQIDLLLQDVVPSVMDGEQWEAFSAIYLGPDNVRIPQGNFLFCHPSFGEITLFVSPNSETEYETVITRQRQCEENNTN